MTSRTSRPDLLAGLFVLGLGLIGFWQASAIPVSPLYAQVGPKVVPYVVAVALTGLGGFLVLAALEYGSLFSTGLLLTPTEPLNVIVALQFIPLLGIVGVISVFTWRRTNSYLPGALICALFLCWYVTSGTANHWSPDSAMTFPPAAKSR
jgi:hypothetical protein